jgi:hypothetical protein
MQVKLLIPSDAVSAFCFCAGTRRLASAAWLAWGSPLRHGGVYQTLLPPLIVPERAAGSLGGLSQHQHTIAQEIARGRRVISLSTQAGF